MWVFYVKILGGIINMPYICIHGISNYTKSIIMEVLIGNKAKNFLSAVFHNHAEIGVWEHPEENQISGYFKNGNCYLAFDSKCDYTVEEFDNEDEAEKYSKGILAKTKDGNEI
jgi:hypothetical protein